MTEAAGGLFCGGEWEQGSRALCGWPWRTAAEGRQARLAVPLGSALSVQLTNEGLPSRHRWKAERWGRGPSALAQVSGGLPRGAPGPWVVGTDGDVSSHTLNKPTKVRVLSSTFGQEALEEFYHLWTWVSQANQNFTDGPNLCCRWKLPPRPPLAVSGQNLSAQLSSPQ